MYINKIQNFIKGSKNINLIKPAKDSMYPYAPAAFTPPENIPGYSFLVEAGRIIQRC